MKSCGISLVRPLGDLGFLAMCDRFRSALGVRILLKTGFAHEAAILDGSVLTDSLASTTLLQQALCDGSAKGRISRPLALDRRPTRPLLVRTRRRHEGASRKGEDLMGRGFVSVPALLVLAMSAGVARAAAPTLID